MGMSTMLTGDATAESPGYGTRSDGRIHGVVKDDSCLLTRMQERARAEVSSLNPDGRALHT
jgi:hypothetical protein